MAFSDSTRDALTEIHGIGDAKVAEIEDVLEDANELDVASDASDGGVGELVAEAHEHHEAGEHQYAGKFVRKAYERLCGE